MITKETIETIISFLKTTNPEINLLGYALGGSQQVGYVTKSSDFDLAFLTLNSSDSWSNRYSFYNHKDKQLIELPAFDLTSLQNISLEEILGYRSETFFWMIRQDTIILNDDYKAIWDRFLSLLTKYEFFWIHCCIKEYKTIIADVLSLIEEKNFVKILKTNIKKLYRLLYIYTQTINKITLSKNLLLNLKSNKLDIITEDEWRDIYSAYEALITKYLLSSKRDEELIFKFFKEELKYIWK